MLVDEANWIAKVIENLPTGDLSPLVNLGSSSLAVRTERQPFIVIKVLLPMEGRGIDIIHSDLKEGEGIDVSGDITDPLTIEKIKARNPKAIMCCNLLEHVSDRVELAKAVDLILPVNGILIVTVPQSYPYHADPIDTFFRPTPEQITFLFPTYSVISSKLVPCHTYATELRKGPSKILRHVLRTLIPFPRWRGWLCALHRWTWLWRPYKVSCVVLRKI